ncbi:hypothetical protein NDA01_14405 [Trichocoleus desertorum AS-A10]|uniref:hypothetical protein n=1 Tax=Trichocoleus desertorum TaxID=1481672 RepID=UPI003297CD36
MSSSPKRPHKPPESVSSHQASPASDPTSNLGSDFAHEQTSSSSPAPTPLQTPADQLSEMTSELASTVNAAERTPPTTPVALGIKSSEDPVSRSEGDELSEQASVMRQQPIPPPSEPKQYRAIGLIRGRYVASPDHFTRGNLVTSDGTAIDAVLLGRVMSLVRKHLDLEQEHLWVVYPRTREKEANLHAQIVGVWEPEKLNQADEGIPQPTTEEPTEASLPEGAASSDHEDGYFSIRGEVIYQALDEERIIVKIRQSPRKDADEEKTFKLLLQGNLTGKAVGHFWDLNAYRQGDVLVIRDGTSIGLLPPRKRQAHERPRAGGVGGRRPRDGQRPSRPSTRPVANAGGSAGAAPVRKAPLPKPVKRKDSSDAQPE